MKERNQKRYRVFAIYGEVEGSDPMIRIGQTKMADLKTVLRYYRNESKTAQDLFKSGVHTEIFLLEMEHLTEAVAYQRRIAWIRYFMEAGSDVITHRKPYEDALNLFGGAEAYYQKIMDIPAETVLNRRNAVPNPECSAEPVSTKQEKHNEELSRRLSVRLAEKDYLTLSKLCNEKGITQKECLRLLLLSAGRNESYAAQVLQEKNKRISELEIENEKLRKDKRQKDAYARLKEAFYFARRGVSLFLRDQLEMMGMPEEDDGEYAYRNLQEYKYPEEEFFYFRLETVQYGKGRHAARFLLGRNCATEKKVKLRFYPREEFCGISPLSAEFYIEDAEFFVGCRRINPDVADLFLASPVFCRHKTNEPTEDEENLESILRDAVRRSKRIW